MSKQYNNVFAYVRVSTEEQDLARQITSITEFCKVNNIPTNKVNLVEEKRSGKNFEDRPAYQRLKSNLRSGDLLIVAEISRLGRNLIEGTKEIIAFRENNIDIAITNAEMFSTFNKDSTQDKNIAFVFSQLGLLYAEMEREYLRERQRQGIEEARKKGIHLGRPKTKIPNNFKIVYDDWVNGLITGAEAIRRLNMSKPTFYRKVKEYQEKNALPSKEELFIERIRQEEREKILEELSLQSNTNVHSQSNDKIETEETYFSEDEGIELDFEDLVPLDSLSNYNTYSSENNSMDYLDFTTKLSDLNNSRE